RTVAEGLVLALEFAAEFLEIPDCEVSLVIGTIRGRFVCETQPMQEVLFDLLGRQRIGEKHMEVDSPGALTDVHELAQPELDVRKDQNARCRFRAVLSEQRYQPLAVA